MGNAGSNQPKDWNKEHATKQPDLGSSSPVKEGEAFTFDKKIDDDRSARDDDNNIEDGAPYYTKAVPEHDVEEPEMRERSNTLTEGKVAEDVKVLPTVFKWDGGGKQVFISGTFTDWKTIPMVKSHGDFVTIIDLPEGEHQYKYFVDGEWRHDPTVDSQVLKSTEHKTRILECFPNEARNEVALTLEQIKNKAATTVEEPVKKVYEDLMTPLYDRGLNILTTIPSYNSTKTAIYSKRKSELGVNKLMYSNITEVEIPKKYEPLILGDYKNANKRIIVLCSKEGKRLLRILKEYFGDATFKSVPRPFVQLLTLHGDLGSTTQNTNIVPILHALMSDKKEDSYFIVYDIIKANIPDWEPSIFHADFEMGLTNPLKDFFPKIIVKRCYYHFINCMWRKAKDKNLKSKLHRRIVGLCAVLPLLPQDKILEGYQYINDQSKELDEIKFKSFLAYMEKTWLKNELCISEWCIYDQLHRTNNFAEGWHSKLNRKINKNYVTIAKLFSVLEKDMLMNKNFENGIHSSKRRKIQTERDTFILNTQLQLIHEEISVGHFMEKLR